MQNITYMELVGFLFPIVVGIISAFIGRLMKDHDKHGEKIENIEKSYVKKEEFEQKQENLKKEIDAEIREEVTCIKNDISSMKKTFREDNNKTVEALDELKEEMKKVQLNYVNNDAFYKENLKLSQKMDKMMDMLIDVKVDSKIKTEIKNEKQRI